MIKTKKILIALAVIGANVLHTMPVYTSLAAEPADFEIITNGGTLTTGDNYFNNRTGITDTIESSNKTYDQQVKGNVNYDDGTFSFNYSDNKIIFRKGTYSNTVYGAFNNTGSDNVTNNKVFVYGGKFTNAINGGQNSSSGSSTGNTVTFEGGTFSAYIFGGYSHNGNAEKNIVHIKGGTFSETGKYIYGGSTGTGTAGGDSEDKGNKVIIDNITFASDAGYNIYGGCATGNGGKANYNSVTINNGTFKTSNKIEIAGGKSNYASGSVANNKVVINGGTFEGTGTEKIIIKGGSGSANLSNNSVEINGGIFTANTSIIAAEGIATGGTYSDNSITIKGTNPIDLSGATLMGYEAYGNNSSTLKVNRTNVKVGDIKNFGTINFALLEGATSDDIVLKMDGSFDVSTLNSVNINIIDSSLTGNDYIVLMQNVTGTYGGSSAGIMQLGDDLIYYTGTAPTTQKGDYTIKQGSVKGDSGTNAGSYTADIIGNTDGTGLTVTGGSLSSASYSGNEVIIRRGTYSKDKYICGAYYTGSDTITMNYNSITVHNGIFHDGSSWNRGFYAAYAAAGAANFTENMITINDGDFGNGTWSNIHTAYAYSSGGSATNNSIVINGGTLGTYKYIDAAHVGGTATGNTVTINGGTFGSDATDAWIDIYGVFLSGGMQVAISDNEVNINAGSFAGKMNIAGVYATDAPGANTYSGNKVNISGGSFDLTYVTDGKINIYGIYRDGSVTVANNNSVVIANAQFNLNDSNDEVNVYGAYVKSVVSIGSVASGNVEHNTVELHDGKFHNVAGGWIINNGNANYNELTIESGTFAGGYDIYAGYVGANGNVVGNKIIINGGDVGDSKEIDAGYIHGDGDATGNIITINGGIIGSDNAVNIYGAEVKNGSATGNKVNITGGTFGKYVTIKGAILWQDNSDAEISENEVNITGGTFDYKINIYGGHASSGTAKKAENNKVTIKNISVANESTIYGGNASATLVKGNGVIIENATFGDTVKVYGGYTESKDAEGNFVTIKSSTFGDGTEIYGAYTDTGNAGGDTEDKGNKVIIDDGSFGDGSAIYSGYVYSSGNANYNKIVINAGTFNNCDIGNWSESGNSDKNVVVINDGNFENYTSGKGIWGGLSNGSGSTNENKIYINGGTFGDDISFWGAYGSDGEAKDNIVEIAGGTFGNNFGLYGGYTISGTSTNNTLNLKTAIAGTAKDVKYFQNVNFTLPEGATSEVTMLKVGTTTPMALADITFTTDLNGLSLTETGDYITLVKNVNDTSFTPATSGLGHYVLDIGGVKELVYSNGTPVAKADFEITSNGVKSAVDNIYFSDGSGTTDTIANTNKTYSNLVQGNVDFTTGAKTTNYSNNEIIIRRGEYAPAVGNVAVAGAYNATGDAISNNTVKIYDGTFKGNIYGGNSSSGEVGGNTVNIYCGTLGVSNVINIYGGYSNTNNVTGNVTNIEGGTFASGSYIRGGGSIDGNATKNTLTINGGTFSGSSNNYFYGGESNNGNAGGNSKEEGNTLNIIGGTFSKSNFYGGKSSYGKALYNSVNVEGGTFGDDSAIYGGYAGGSGNATDNTVTIIGGTFGNNFGLYGGYTSGTSSNNTLNLKIKMGGKASEVKYFQNMNFTLPSGTDDGTPMLKTENMAFDSTNTIINVNASLATLSDGQIITLIAADNEPTGTYTPGTITGVGEAIITLDGYNLILKIITAASGGDEDQQKAPVEGIAAAVQIVNQSADLASGEGMKSLIAETAGGLTNTFGALTTGQSKYKTGSHVDVDGWGILVGAGKTKEWGNGEATSLGVFFEYGKGDFDTYNGNVHGDGNSKNQGIGFMMRHKMLNNTYYEGNIRYGKQSTEWSESEIGSYDTDSRYYGISVGMGHIYQAGKNEIDVYGRYTYGHVGACDATVGTSEYHFDSVKSHRVRVGGKYNFKQKNSNAKPYVGLAWEHEFKGETRATISGVGEAPAPSMKGNTGILEVGCDWNVSKKWTVGLGANAYVGKRKGWDGMARVFYNF